MRSHQHGRCTNLVGNAVMSGAMDYFAYRSDDGKIYELRRNQFHLEAVGTSTYHVNEHSQPPGDMRPRYIVARHPDGKTAREVVVDDVTRPAWTGEVKVLQLPDWASSPTGQLIAFRITLRVAERVSGTRTTRRKRILPQSSS